MLAAFAANRLLPVRCSAAPTNLKPEQRSVYAADEFPAFLPKEVDKIKDSNAIKLAKRIERFPVPLSWVFCEISIIDDKLRRHCSDFPFLSNLFCINQILGSKSCIMSSFVRPSVQGGSTEPVVLLHGFDSSCLEWRYTYPLLEEAGLEIWAVDILGWGFSDLEILPSCNPVSKRDHLFQLWRSCINRPMVLVGPSLGAAVAIDFAVNYPEAVSKLILIDASVYSEGTGNMASLPKIVAYAGVALLKSFLLRFYALKLAIHELPPSIILDWVNIGRLHCQMPWWEEATINFMQSGGYNVTSLIKQVKQKTLIIWGENDQIISNKLAVRLHSEMQDATIRQIPDSGHIPHVETPKAAANLIIKFVQDGNC